MARVNMLGDGLLRVWVVLTNKAAFLAETHFHKTLITDDDVLQAQKFLPIERRSARLAYGAVPSLDTVLRRLRLRLRSLTWNPHARADPSVLR